jgi:hypothetical protein
VLDRISDEEQSHLAFGIGKFLTFINQNNKNVTQLTDAVYHEMGLALDLSHVSLIETRGEQEQHEVEEEEASASASNNEDTTISEEDCV